MSTYFNLACNTCKEKLWIGKNGYLFMEEYSLKQLEKFLCKHMSGCELEHSDEHDKKFLYYKDFPENKKLKKYWEKKENKLYKALKEFKRIVDNDPKMKKKLQAIYDDYDIDWLEEYGFLK